MFTQCSKLTKKQAIIIIIIFGVICTAAVLICTRPGSGFGLREIINASTVDGREKYLNSLGWEIDTDSEVEQNVLLPKEFNDVLTEYNAMQLEQGFDLSEYAGCECSQYSYIITNYEYSGTVYATLYIRGCRVIGGDIHSAAVDGFMHGLK